MEYIQIEINNHKTKLLSLINNLINTQLINEEIFINYEIKKESECLISLLNIKQNTIMNQNNINNNIYINPLLFNQNQMIMNQSPINNNQLQSQFISNNFINNKEIAAQLINVRFEDLSGKVTIIICSANEKISNIIKKYREKANDYNKNRFIFNGKELNPLMSLFDSGIFTDSKIIVSKYNCVIGTKFDILLFSN